MLKKLFGLREQPKDTKVTILPVDNEQENQLDLKMSILFALVLVVCGFLLGKLAFTVVNSWDKFKADFVFNFLEGNRWQLLVNGLGQTMSISFFACLLGVLLGIIVAVIRSTWDTNTSKARYRGIIYYVMKFLNFLCKAYTTIIRGTPVVVQLLIMFYIIFVSSRNGELVATLTFGINSGAYVSEIIRSGIMSIDKGQMEAGRSLGFSYVKTMRLIIMPQVLKNVLPPLANEFIVLLKETSVAAYVAVKDLTWAGNRIRGKTYSDMLPLIAIALIYLVVVMFFTWLVSLLERRLRASDNR